MIGARLRLGQLPLQLKGLLGGIDPEKLKAEYVAVPLKMMTTGDKPVSRLQALVDYRQPAGSSKPELAPDHGDDANAGGQPAKSYGYDVQRLVVEFANGEVLRA